MGLSLKFHCCLVFVMVLLPELCYSQGYFEKSRATYYGSPDYLGTPSGACGYGESGRTTNDASVAGASRLFKNGTGCGACYQVRCTNPQLCRENGVNIVVTDHGEGDHTDFILSPLAYSRMARYDAAAQLFAYGVVDVEYQRIPCTYNGGGIQLRVHEDSRYPSYLAFVIMYHPGRTEILTVEIWRAEEQAWVEMRRAYGAFYDTTNLKYGSIRLRFRMIVGVDTLTWAQTSNLIPADWKAGILYESDIQF